MICKECGNEIDDNSMFCNFCGSKQNEGQNKILNINNTDNAVNSIGNIKCPNCDSEQVQKFSVVHLNGISDLNGTSVGVGTSGIYSGFVNGTSQTALSKITAPPEKKWVIGRFILLGLLLGCVGSYFTSRVRSFGVLYGFCLMFINLVVPIIYAIRGYLYNKYIYNILNNMWDHKYLCLKCGHQFNLNNLNFEVEEKQLKDKISNWKKYGWLLFLLTIVVIIYMFNYALKN